MNTSTSIETRLSEAVKQARRWLSSFAECDEKRLEMVQPGDLNSYCGISQGITYRALLKSGIDKSKIYPLNVIDVWKHRRGAHAFLTVEDDDSLYIVDLTLSQFFDDYSPTFKQWEPILRRGYFKVTPESFQEYSEITTSHYFDSPKTPTPTNRLKQYGDLDFSDEELDKVILSSYYTIIRTY